MAFASLSGSCEKQGSGWDGGVWRPNLHPVSTTERMRSPVIRHSSPLVSRMLGALPRWIKARRVHIADEHRKVYAEASEMLNASMADMEKSFVVIGESLMTLDSCSRELIAKCELLLHLAAGSDEGEALLRASLDTLKAPLEYIDFCMERQSRLLELLVHCEQKTRGMLGIRDRMRDAIAPLTYMAVMFKIESAYLPAEHRETFLTVTSEVERLHQLVNETFAQNAQQLELAHSTLAEVRVRLEGEFRKHSEIVTGKRSRIDAAINSLNSQLEQNTERDMRLHDHGAALSSEVSRIVMGVQFQDIVKQKCDHVVEALAKVPASDKEWAHMLGLQIHHLKAVQTDIREGHRVMSEGLDRINGYTERLNQNTVSLENIESMTAAMDGMVQLLLDTLTDVHEIIRMVADVTSQGHDAVQPARGLASNLTSAIVELSVNMQMIALNAQVRSVQSGQGTGLEMLAARTAEISSEINEISMQISRDLSELHEAIDQMLAMFQEFSSRGATEFAALNAARGPAEEKLHALRNATIDAIQQIGDRIDSMFSAVKTVHGSLDALTLHREALDAMIGRLEGYAPEVDVSSEEGKDHAVEMLARYTMASEREVHESFLAQAGGQSAALTEKPAPDASSSSDSNVETWEDFSAPVAPSTPAVGSQVSSASEPPPPTPDADADSKKDSSSKSPTQSSKADSLGDNVELF